MARLMIFHAGTLPQAKEGDAPPSRIRICPWGETRTEKGIIRCTDRTARDLPAAQAAARRDRVALDFNHNTVPGAEAYRGEPAPIAAMGPLEVVPGEGIFLRDLDWREAGVKAYAARDYEDISPALITDDDGNVIFIHSAAMARQGIIEGLTLFAAGSHEEILRLINQTPRTGEKKQETQVEKYKELLLQLLKLPADATDDQIREAVTKALSGAPDGEVKAMSARLDEMAARIKTFDAAEEGRQRDAIVAAAAREGKIIPLSADEIGSTPVKTLASMVEKLPATVPMEQRTGQVKEFSAGTPAAGEACDVVRAQLGIGKEKWEKFAGKTVAALGAMLLAAALALAPCGARAAAATADVATAERQGMILSVPMATNTTIYAGTIVAISNGWAVTAKDIAGHTVVGRAEAYAANAGTNGQASVRVKRGVFEWDNSATDPVDADDLGAFCYVEDDLTVSETGGSATNRAGIVVDIGTNTVWVDTTRVTHPSTSVGADAVGSANIADDAVSLEHLDSGITPARVPVLWTNVTITGTVTTNAVTVTGVAATDAILVTPLVNGQNLAIYEATPSENTVTLRTSLVPTNTQIAIGVFRAAQ